jgi:hypothetical protein
MDSITVKNIKINLDIINPQTSTLGREFVLSQIKLDVSKAPKYIDKMYKHCTWYIFKYLDNGSEFAFYMDEYDKFQYKLNHDDIKKLNAIQKSF